MSRTHAGLDALRTLGAAVAMLVICAGIVASSAAASAPLQWSSPQVVDNAAPYGHSADLTRLSCPSASLCVAITGGGGLDPGSRGRVLTTAQPGVTGTPWVATQVDTAALVDLSCASVSLCVAVDDDGEYTVSSDPSNQTWSMPTKVGAGFASVSCPTVSMCVGVGGDGQTFVSNSPAGGPGTWSESGTVAAGFVTGRHSLDCPTVSFCVVWDSYPSPYDPGFATTTTPSGQGPWAVVTIDGSNQINDVACPGVDLCVGVDGAGNALVSTDPESDQASWSVTPIDSSPLTGISCPSTTLCVATDQQGGIVTSTDPAGGPSAWGPVSSVDPSGGVITPGVPFVATGPGELTGVTIGDSDVDSISCPTTTFCVAVDAYGHDLISTTPTGGASAWTVGVAAPGFDSLEGMSCPTTHLCAAIDDAGRVIVSTTPGSTPTRWNVTTLSNLADGAGPEIVCTALPFCLAANTSYVYTGGGKPARGSVTAQPNGDAQAWSSIADLSYVSGTKCLAPYTCLAYGPSDAPWIVANRAASGDVWSETYLTSREGLVCLLPDCIYPDANGAIEVSASPSKGGWRAVQIDTTPDPTRTGMAASLLGLSCAGQAMCAAFDDAGNILTSTNPTGPADAWTSVHPNLPASLTELICPSSSLCVGADGLGDVVTSTDPLASAATWTVSPIDPGSYITSLECPSATLCLAGDESGRIVIGRGDTAATPTGVTTAAALSALRAALLQSCSGEQAKQVIRSRGCATPFVPPGTGAVTITWRIHDRLIARVSAPIPPNTGPMVLTPLLNRDGLRLLRRLRHSSALHVQAVFLDAAGHDHRDSTTITLRR